MAARPAVPFLRNTMYDKEDELDEVDVASAEKNHFYHNLIDQSQFRSTRDFKTGSRLEIDGQNNILVKYKLSTYMCDLDRMYYSTGWYAFPRQKSIPESYNGEVIRIYTNGHHPSYARLIREKDNKELELSDILSPSYKLKADEKNGPSIPIDTATELAEDAHKFLGGKTQNTNTAVDANRNIVKFHDNVFSIHSPYWPAEANEWITRDRPYNSPSKSIIKEIVRYGCDFVQVSHHTDNKCEWRFSFSKAELIIIHKWSTSQRVVYRTIHILYKMIKKQIVSSRFTALRTYHFKTMMLWATEKKPREFWFDDGLVMCVCELLIDMSHWLEIKRYPNYFIPSNNMIDELVDTDLSGDIEALYRLRDNQQLIREVLSCSKTVERASGSSSIYQIELPSWIYRSFVIYDRVHNFTDNYKALFNKGFSSDLHSVLSQELSDIYRGLISHKNAASCSAVSNRSDDLRKAVRHLTKAISFCESQQNTTEHCSWTVADSVLQSWFKQVESDAGKLDEAGVFHMTKDTLKYASGNLKALHEPLHEPSHKCLIYNPCIDEMENMQKINVKPNRPIIHESYRNRSVDITLHTTYPVNEQMDTDTDVEFYKEWPVQSPTVNISWFIAMSYVANIYYATQPNYSAATEMCNDIIYASRQSYWNQWFAEQMFPVVLSTQLADVYDKEIQEMIGLYSLCSFVIDKLGRSRSVYLGVCPVLFALYLKYCCARDHGRSRSFKKCKDDYNQHENVCKCNKRVNNGRFAVNCALFQRERSRINQLVNIISNIITSM